MNTKQALLAEFERRCDREQRDTLKDSNFQLDENEVRCFLAAALDRVERETWERARDGAQSDREYERITDSALMDGHELPTIAERE